MARCMDVLVDGRFPIGSYLTSYYAKICHPLCAQPNEEVDQRIRCKAEAHKLPARDCLKHAAILPDFARSSKRSHLLKADALPEQ